VAFLRGLLAVLLLVCTIGAGVLFGLQNTVAVPLDLLVIQLPERSLALWILLALGLGLVVGLATAAFMLFNLRTRLAALRRQRDRLSTEVDRLRKVGLTGGE